MLSWCKLSIHAKETKDGSIQDYTISYWFKYNVNSS